MPNAALSAGYVFPVDTAEMAVGLTDLVLGPGGDVLYATGRAGGWVLSYDLGAGPGQAALSDHWQIPDSYLQLERPDLLIRPDSGAGDLLLAGLRSNDLLALDLHGAGSDLGGGRLYDAGAFDLGQISEIVPDPDGQGALAALRGGGLVQLGFSGTQTISVTTVSEGGPFAGARADALTLFDCQGHSYAVAAYGAGDGIALLRAGASGAFSHVQSLTATDGLWIDQPGALTAVTGTDGAAYVVLAASGSSSLTVLRLEGGQLVPVSHRIDDAGTRFAQVSHVQSVEIAGQPYVVAAGGDQGVSLFALLPGGRLAHVTSVAASEALPIGGISALSLQPLADGLRVFLATETAPYLIELHIDFPQIGAVQTGSDTGDTLAGTAGDDVIAGQGGADSLSGGSGDDLILDGAGADRLRGGAGADQFILLADGAVDVILDFDPNHDLIELSSPDVLGDPADVQVLSRSWGAELRLGTEVLHVYAAGGGALQASDFEGRLHLAAEITVDPEAYGDPGPVQGPESGSTLEPTRLPGLPPLAPVAGAEPIVALPSAAHRRGTASGEEIRTYGGHDQVTGLGGNDLITTGAGNDIVLGGMGFDTIEGSWGDDTLAGEGNADRLYGGGGQDLLSGGDGYDWLFGDAGHDTLWGGRAPDRLLGGDGNDWLHAGSNFGLTVDGLYGEAGADTLFGGAGFDYLSGGDGDDVLDGGHQADNLYGDAGSDTLFGDLGLDRLFGGDGDDLLSGGDGPDGHFGQAGNDVAWGGAGHDRFFGGSGNDILSGGLGRDTLRGNAGFDTLIGGAGDDDLYGNFNADRFVFADGHGHDRVFDFNPDNAFELLDFSQLSTLSGTTDVILAAIQDGADVVITTGADSSIRLMDVNLPDLEGGNFLF